MDSEPGNSWRELADQAASEQDPQKLYELLREINRLKDEQKRVRADKSPANVD
jgi:hypothetical protein